jgi:hypothetical protein
MEMLPKQPFGHSGYYPPTWSDTILSRAHIWGSAAKSGVMFKWSLLVVAGLVWMWEPHDLMKYEPFSVAWKKEAAKKEKERQKQLRESAE